MTSAFVDSLKYALSDKYDLLDRDYYMLSSILLDGGVSESKVAGKLVNLFAALDRSSGIEFPMTLSFFEEFYNQNIKTYDFSQVVSDFVRLGLLIDNYLTQTDFQRCLKAGAIFSTEADKLGMPVQVFYPSRNFVGAYRGFCSVVSKSPIVEDLSVRDTPESIKDLIRKVSKLVKKYSIKISKESCSEGTSIGLIDVNLIFSNLSPISLTGKELTNLAAKNLSKIKSVSGIEIYQDGKNEIFMCLSLNLSNLITDQVAGSVFKMIEEIEFLSEDDG